MASQDLIGIMMGKQKDRANQLEAKYGVRISIINRGEGRVSVMITGSIKSELTVNEISQASKTFSIRVSKHIYVL